MKGSDKQRSSQGLSRESRARLNYDTRDMQVRALLNSFFLNVMVACFSEFCKTLALALRVVEEGVDHLIDSSPV